MFYFFKKLFFQGVAVCFLATCLFLPSFGVAQNEQPTEDLQFNEQPTEDLQFNEQPTGVSGGGVTINNPLAAKSITEFFFQLIEILLIFAIPIIVFFIILAGFRFVTAQGDTNKLSDAKRALLYAIVGGLLILGAYIILEVIESTVNAFRV